MSEFTIDRLRDSELPSFREFCEIHWGARHPLIHDEKTFNYYYRRGDKINFLRAADGETGELLGVVGFIPSNELSSPDIFISYILTKKGAPLNLGFHLIEEVVKLTGCRALGVNNVRKKVRGLYEFLGYTLVDFPHYYRLNPDKRDYTLCNIVRRTILPVEENGVVLRKFEDKKELDSFVFEDYAQARPYKDKHYLVHRFFENPWINYEVFGVGDDAGLFAVVVLRVFEYEGSVVLRLVDYVGDRGRFAEIGYPLDRLSREHGADFTDLYCYGIDEAAINGAGFVRRQKKDENVIPDYLSPPLMENVDYYSVVDRTDDYVMFRADGDQDRPNIEV